MPLFKVIKYEGDPHTFVWKHPNAEIGTWTQLIVNESQEAVLFKGGQALDLFSPGRHTLETANIPLLRNLVNIPFGGSSPFAAEVWYVNKASTLNIKWGTPTPIQLQDPKYNVLIPVRSFGQFGIKVSDSKTLLIKLVGTLKTFTSDSIIEYFRGVYLTMVKDAIAGYLVTKKVPIFEINANILELSESIKDNVAPKLEEYGINLINFYVNDINVPEDDTAVIKLKDALAKRAEMDIVGYTYAQERSFDTLEGAATNPGAAQAGLMGAGVGLGMGLGVGGAMGSQMGGIAQVIETNEKKKCPGCNSDMESSARFCPSCGKLTQKCCPKCNTVLEKDNAKFCLECGESLVKKCNDCGAQIDGNPKFCPECGGKIERE